MVLGVGRAGTVAVWRRDPPIAGLKPEPALPEPDKQTTTTLNANLPQNGLYAMRRGWRFSSRPARSKRAPSCGRREPRGANGRWCGPGDPARGPRRQRSAGRQPPLTIDELLGADNNPVHPDKRTRTATTVDHGQGSLQFSSHQPPPRHRSRSDSRTKQPSEVMA